MTAIVCFLGLLLATAAAAQNQPRIALIITNQNYSLKELELKNPHADGDLLKAALEAVDFDVTVVRDTAHRGELEDAIGKYVARLAEAGPDAVGFFYYSGHGAADGPRGRNYLLPTGPKIDHAAQLRLSAVSVETIVNALAEAGGKMNFVVFDACRNVPLKRPDKSNYKGFAPYRDAPGMLIAYATEPGDVAADENHYSRALAEEIVKPNREAGSVFRAVSGRVFQATGGHQRPVPVDKRFDDFYFKPAVGIPAQLPRVSAQPACDGVEVSLGAGGSQCIKPGSGESFRDCADCPEMVVVPAGSFMMGSPENEPERDQDEGPQHKVTILQPFAVGKFEVTFDEWDACVADGKCGDNRPRDFGWGRGYRPVIEVSWADITAHYLSWLSRKTGKIYRLLSEAEWEYAARAGETTPFWWGTSITTDQANYKWESCLWRRNDGRVPSKDSAS